MWDGDHIESQANGFPNGAQGHFSDRNRFMGSDFDWSDFINMSTAGPSPSRTPSSSVQIPPNVTMPKQTSNGYAALPPSLSPESDPGLHGELIRHLESQSSSSFAIGQKYDRFNFGGCEPEVIVMPLNFMKAHLFNSLDYSLLDWYTFQGFRMHELFDMIHSEWLWLEIEDLLCCVWEFSAKATRRRQRERNSANRLSARSSDSATGNTRAAIHGDAMKQDCGWHKSRAKDSSTFISAAPNGSLRVQLAVTTSAPLPFPNDESFHILTISAMPKSRKRTIGASVTFVRPVGGSLSSQICPYIETFNVVPKDSDIIQCVSRNDIKGVQKLFDAGLASPLDVDPFGFSLLSVFWPHPG